MRLTKRAIAIQVALVLSLLLCASPAIAAEPPPTLAELDATLAQFDQQIAAIQAEADALLAQTNPYTSQAHVIVGFVLTQDPFIVVGGGYGDNLIMDALLDQKQTQYFQITDPEHGAYNVDGFYEGMHQFKQRIYNPELDANIDVMGPFADEYYPLYQQYEAKAEQIKALQAQKDKVTQQRSAVLRQCHDAVVAYSSNDQSDIVFQLDNPFVMAYGQANLIEAGNFDARPMAVSGVTLVPIRAVMDAVGGDTLWSPDAPNDVHLSLLPNEILLRLNDTTAYVNGEAVTLSVAPQVINGKTMIPLRFVSETLGMNVEWIQDASVIRITYPKNWTDRMDQYYTDNKDGTKHFIDLVNGCQYDLPEDCQITPSDSSGLNGSIEITRPGINGSLTVYQSGGKPPAWNDITSLSLTPQQKSEGIQSILYSEVGGEPDTYYVSAWCFGEGSLVISIQAESDTVIWDASDPYINTPEFQAEIDKNYAALREAAEMLIANLASLAVG